MQGSMTFLSGGHTVCFVAFPIVVEQGFKG